MDDTWSDTHSMPDVDTPRSIIRKISTNGIKNRRFHPRTPTDTLINAEWLSSLTWMDYLHYQVLKSSHPLTLQYQSFYQTQNASFSSNFFEFN